MTYEELERKERELEKRLAQVKRERDTIQFFLDCYNENQRNLDVLQSSLQKILDAEREKDLNSLNKTRQKIAEKEQRLREIQSQLGYEKPESVKNRQVAMVV